MASNLFSGDIWTKVELKELLKELEQMYAGGVRQGSFKDQTLIFGSTTELKIRIGDLRSAIDERDLEDGTTVGKSKYSKKIIKFKTPNKGFS